MSTATIAIKFSDRDSVFFNNSDSELAHVDIDATCEAFDQMLAFALADCYPEYRIFLSTHDTYVFADTDDLERDILETIAYITSSLLDTLDSWIVMLPKDQDTLSAVWDSAKTPVYRVMSRFYNRDTHATEEANLFYASVREIPQYSSIRIGGNRKLPAILYTDDWEGFSWISVDHFDEWDRAGLLQPERALQTA